jgi:uncharacterized damage-inducible protein DinB
MTAMPSSDSLLEETLELWSFARDGIIEEFENIPADDFDFRPHPQSRTVADLARHVLESALMAAGELTREDGDFRRKPYPALIEEYAGHVTGLADRATLIAALRDSHADALRRIRAAGGDFMMRPIRRFDGRSGTRYAWLQHALDHESYHRGQVALYARMMGHVPALTRRIHGDGES